MRKCLICLALFLVIMPLASYAQDDGGMFLLIPGEDQSGTLNSDTFAQNYIFSGSEGDAITVDAFSESAEVTLVLLLTAPDGDIVAQDTDIESPFEALIGDFELPQDGRYVLTVMRAEGASGDEEGDYTLVLTGQLTPPTTEDAAPATETTTQAAPSVRPGYAMIGGNGLQFNLAWNAAVNMNLEVRDPIGGSVFVDSGDSESGGSLSGDVNGTCASATDSNPNETISWDAGEIPAGSYEIIIYYLEGCGVGGSQVFNLSATVGNDEPGSIEATLLPTQKYLASLEIEPTGDWTLYNGGVNAGFAAGILQPQIDAAQPFQGAQETGTINRAQPAVAYTFVSEGIPGDVLQIDMQAISGSLDTYLMLLGPGGFELASNDDSTANTTNSSLAQSIEQPGTYTIIATRYGQIIGGTEGDFQVTLSLTTDTAVAAAPSTGGTGAGAGAGTDATTEGGLLAPSGTDTTAGTDPLTTDGTTDGATDATQTNTVNIDGLPSGSVEVALTWDTGADIQLLVRDPDGTAIFDDVPNAPSGGILQEDGNVGCSVSDSPLSYIYWPTSLLPRGIYEVEIWYQNNCNDTRPVSWTLSVSVEDEEIINTTQPATPDSQFAITFEVDQDGNATAAEGGFFDMENASTIDYFSQLADADPIEYGDTINNEITSEGRFQLYAFEGETGDRVRVSMRRTSGTLDTALFLISPDGVQLANNDDIIDAATGERQTDSLIDNITLTQDGTYYIIATHYGLQYGGTVGTYNLTLFQMPSE